MAETNDPLADVIRQELVAALSDQSSEVNSSVSGEDVLKLVVSVSGPNQPGIVYLLAQALHHFQGDIRDMSQTIVGGHFTMLMVVHIPGLGFELFGRVKQSLTDMAESAGVHAVVMHEDMAAAMNTI